MESTLTAVGVDDAAAKTTTFHNDGTSPALSPQQQPQTAEATASGIFASLALDQLNIQDVRVVLQTQNQIIKRLDQTNKNLAVTNQLSTETFNSFALKDFQSYILLLNKMNNDLNYIFKHIKVVKAKLQAKYPSQYDKALKEHKSSVDLDDEEEDELETAGSGDAATILKQQSDQSTIEAQFKDRSLSTESAASSSSTLSSSKSLLVNLYETAKTRLSNIEFANNLVNSTPSSTLPPQQSQSSPTPTRQQSRNSPLITEATATPTNTPINSNNEPSTMTDTTTISEVVSNNNSESDAKPEAAVSAEEEETSQDQINESNK